MSDFNADLWGLRIRAAMQTGSETTQKQFAAMLERKVGLTWQDLVGMAREPIAAVSIMDRPFEAMIFGASKETIALIEENRPLRLLVHYLPMSASPCPADEYRLLSSADADAIKAIDEAIKAQKEYGSPTSP